MMGMPQKILDLEIENERLSKANEILMGEVSRLKRSAKLHSELAIKRGKMIEAIKLILSEKWVLDSSGKEIQIVKAPEKNLVMDRKALLAKHHSS